ncbi:MAG: dimethylsulfonioproprionate lyase family protein [Pseudomonadota bacterium]
MNEILRLSDHPDFLYLLREFQNLYCQGKAGGSAKIRPHRNRVRETISRLIDRDPPVRPQERQDKPVTVHLKRALDNGRWEPTNSIIRSIESVAPTLNWLYGYEKVPPGLVKRYAFAQVAHSDGPIVSDEINLGVVLFGPKCIYPAHRHEGLTESYYVLSGTVSQNDDGVYAPGSLIFNPPGRQQRITVSDTEPALLAYAWHAPPETLSSNRMTFSRKERKKP